MEFLHTNNDPDAPIDALRVNWYYRPKDILRRVQDTRVVFASMHSDTCPLTSIRGKCTIQHLSDIPNLDQYRVQKDCFWFDKLYDRYMHRYYEVIPTGRVVNVPQHVKIVLDQRWKFVLVEIGRGRELTSESKKCKKCEQFAASHDSVDCAVCKHTYHMRCVRPPLLKKPARGFAWACAACSRARELKLDSRHTGPAAESAPAGEDELMEEDEEDGPAPPAPGKDQETRESSVAAEAHRPPTAAQIAQANLWPWRYLGVHARAEDALDYDDRIYPRASSRLGPRHQANVNVWHGRPVELVKPSEIKRKYFKHASHLKTTKPSRDSAGGTESDKDHRSKRPKWVVDEPFGYVPRGQDEPVEIKGKKEHTAQLLFKLPDPVQLTDRGGDDDDRPANAEQLVDDYMKRVKPIASQYNLLDSSVDFLTKAIEKLHEHGFDVEKALTAMRALSLRGDLKQPDLNREEIKRFEEGVAKYGSELHAVSRHVGAHVKESRIVRYYYLWKKTDRGRQIWGNYEGRRSKKESKRVDKDGAGAKLLDDVADDRDDSAFDSEKAKQRKRGFECKFCGTRSSRQWRRAPGTAPGTLVPADPPAATAASSSSSSKNVKDKSTWLTLALCGRCAYLWRRYAIQYESIEEVSKKIAAAGGRAAKRRIDEELMRTIFEAQSESGDLLSTRVADEVNKAGMEVPQSIVQHEEPPKKKTKAEREVGTAGTPDAERKKVVAPEKLPEPEPIVAEAPRVKIHPCAVCHAIEAPGQELLKCRDCRLHVHGACYGVGSKTNTKPWYCDMCRNDHNLQVSTIYECVLCPVKYTAQDLMEPLRASHKKKSDREREKERLEREIIQEAGRLFRQEQEAAGRPVNPREALKRTAWNNWVHITCALWTKEIKFGNAELLDDAEGIGFIPRERYEPACKVCKQTGMATVKCYLSTCSAHFHVGCAHQAGYTFGFDVSPVKSSRRDAVNVMKLEHETGIVTAAIWCPNHIPTTTYVHSMLEPTESGLTAMQLFARTYKQVDASITGTVRRAAQFTANVGGSSSAAGPIVVPPSQRRSSTINGAPNGSASNQAEKVAGHSLHLSPVADSPRSVDEPQAESRVADSRVQKAGQERSKDGPKKCCSCLVEVSPKWWPVAHTPARESHTPSPSMNGVLQDAKSDHGTVGYDINQHPTAGDTHAGQLASQGGPSQDTVMTNGVVKTEPSEFGVISTWSDPRDRSMYQCHKCHVQKRTPPSSPSQVKPRERPRPEPPQEPLFYQAPFAPPPPVYPHGRPPPYEGPTHAHPLATPVVAHHSPWQGGPPQWSAPVLRAGSHATAAPPPPPPPPTHVGSIYAPTAYRPPEPEYSASYSSRPSHPAAYTTVPPPPPPNVVPHHSPPPLPPYGHQIHQHPPPPPAPTPSARPPSSPRFGPDRPPVLSPRLGLGSSSILSRPFVPELARQGNVDSPVNGYSGLSTSRVYSQPPPPVRPASTQAPSLAQIAQAASEQGPAPHSRRPSADGAGTPRVGARLMESPTQRPITPASGSRDDPRAGPGASASPSLRNLLS